VKKNVLGHCLLSKRQTIDLQPLKVLPRPRNEFVIQGLCPGLAFPLSQNQDGRRQLGEVLQIANGSSVIRTKARQKDVQNTGVASGLTIRTTLHLSIVEIRVHPRCLIQEPDLQKLS